MSDIYDIAHKKALDILHRQEEVLEAFVSKYGYQPDEMVICQDITNDKWWVEKRSHTENYEKMLEFVKKISTQDWLDESNASDAYAEIGFLTNMADDLLEEMGMTDE